MTRNEQTTFCDPAQASPNPEEVRFCDPAQDSPAPEEIVFCNKCGDFPEVTLAGDATPQVGDRYAASGGKPPYIYSISAGAITPNTGVITSLEGACGTGTITVKDSCGQSASLDVRFPSGQWVLVEDNYLSDPSYTSNDYTFYIGGKKYIMNGSDTCWYTWTDGGGGCPTDGSGPIPTGENVYDRHPNFGEYCEGQPSCNGGASYANGTGVRLYFWRTEKVYEWQCP